MVNKKTWSFSPLLIAVVLFVASVLLRYGISDFAKKIYVYSDELRYFSIAESLFRGDGIKIYNNPVDFQKILYSIVIMPAFALTTRLSQLKAISLINALVISSGVFPVYLLAKRIFGDKQNIILSLLIYITIPDLSYSMTFMSEVIFLPLGLCELYLFYRLISSDHRKSILLSAFLGGLTFILYLNKEIALSFLVAYTIYLGITVLAAMRKRKHDFFHSHVKPSCISLAVMWGVFIALFVIFKLTIFKGMGNSYHQMGIEAILSWYNFGYLLYGFFYFLLCVLIAFFYFPIIFPLIHLKSMDRDRKHFFVLLVLILLVSAGIIAYTITVREDLGRIVPRIHLRYICFLFLPIFMVFLAEFTEGRAVNRIKGIWTAIIGLLFVVIIVLFFHGVLDSSSVDETALKYISNIQSNIQIVGLLKFLHNKTTFVFYGVKLFLCLGVAVGTYAVYKKRRTFVPSLIIVMLCINIINNLSAIKQYKDNYSISKEDYAEVEELNDFIRVNQDKNFMILSAYPNNSQRLLDTYISYPNVFTVSMDQIIEAGRAGEKRLDETKIFPRIGTTPYENLRTVDFVIVDSENGYTVKTGEYETISLHHTGRYHLYKTPDNQKIPECAGAIPEESGETTFLPPSSNLFYSMETLEKGTFVSTEGKRYLVYGPYKKITKGRYDITFYYDYTGFSTNDELLGYVDLNSENGDLIKYNSAFRAGEKQVTLEDVDIEKNCDRFETRMFTFVPDVEFKGISMTKIGY